MTVKLSALAGAGWQFLDANGNPYAGGKLYSYSAGTTLPATTYTTSTGVTSNTNPIILDSAGRVPYEIWVTSGADYKFILYDAFDVLVFSKDDIPGINDVSGLPSFIADLANTSDPAKGDALIGFRQSSSSGNLANTVGRTVHQKLQEIVHIDDFNGNLLNAINATPAGAVLQLGKGPYVANFSVTRSDITIRGAGMPWYGVGYTSLVGGTIIQGTLRFTGSQITVESLGVDCGSVVCSAINAGSPMDCLVINDAARATMYNCTIRDVITLCKEPTSAVHNFLMEGLSDSRFENLHARYGQWGVVLKTQASTADGLYANDCSQAGFTFKSDTGVMGAPANTTSVTNVYVNANGYPTAETCILIYSATYELHDFNLSGFDLTSGKVGIKMLCPARTDPSAILNRNINISNGIINTSTVFGIEAYGRNASVNISNVSMYGIISTTGLKVWPDCYGIELNNIVVSNTNTTATNVDLGGIFAFNNLVSCKNDSWVQIQGINLDPDSASTMRIGSYWGTLYNASAPLTLTRTNGWTTVALATLGINVMSNRVALTGKIGVPATPWTGKENALTFQVDVAPLTERTYTASAYSVTTPRQAVRVTVNSSGVVTIPDLTNTAGFLADTTWVCMDGISWELGS